MILRPSTVATKYRVLTIPGDLPDGADPYAHVANLTEFRSRTAADKRCDTLAKAGHVPILQVAVVRWMPADEADKALGELAARGLPLED